MKKFQINGYAVYEEYDRSSNLLHIVSNKTLAEELVRNNSYRRYEPYLDVIVVFDTMEEIKKNSNDAIIAGAMAKLTIEERLALGLQ